MTPLSSMRFYNVLFLYKRLNNITVYTEQLNKISFRVLQKINTRSVNTLYVENFIVYEMLSKIVQ